tara:strand:+ start:3899 stop:4753 length:855 start_codon:yes stop_codon:yes gene_type:complete
MGRHHLFAIVAPIFWSIAGITVRFIESATAWQINFYRSSSMAIFVLLFLVTRYGSGIHRMLKESGVLAILAGLILSGAMICNIVALVHTTVANAVLVMAAGPVLAAVIGGIILREKTSPILWVSIFLALAGIAVMVGGNYSQDRLFGDSVALLGVVFFGFYAVAVRYGKATDMTPAVMFGGISGAVVAGLVCFTTKTGFSIPAMDLYLCLLLGIVQVGIGSVLFAIAAQSVPAVGLTLYALGEPVLGPLWAWLGVGEAPSFLTFVGGGILICGLLLHVLSSRSK